MSTAETVFPVVVVVAALVVRMSISELRAPGSARQQLAFAGDRPALAAGALAGSATVLLGWSQAGPGAIAWAFLVGALTAHLVHRAAHRP